MPQMVFVGEVGVEQLRAQVFRAGGDEDEFFLFQSRFCGGEGVELAVDADADAAAAWALAVIAQRRGAGA